MPLPTLDLSLDMDVMDGFRELAFRRARSDSLLEKQVLERCVRHQVTEKEAATGSVALTSQDVVWNVPAIALSGRPHPADLLDEVLEDSTARTWTILQADEATLGTRWRLICRDLVLTEELDHLVDIYRPVNRQDAAGARVADYLPTRLALPARIQELDAETIDERGKRGLLRRFDIHLSEQIVITNEYQIRHQPTGEPEVIYQVVGYTAPEAIDQLMVVHCTLNP